MGCRLFLGSGFFTKLAVRNVYRDLTIFNTGGIGRGGGGLFAQFPGGGWTSLGGTLWTKFLCPYEVSSRYIICM